MTAKSADTRQMTVPLIDSYLEMLMGVFTLRIPGVRELVCQASPEIEVTSSLPGQSLIIHTHVMFADLAAGGPGLRRAVSQINRVFVAAMWDALTMHKTYDSIATKPEIQFFRHVRNACAHGGTFNFEGLQHPARWRHIDLTMQHRGMAVFPDVLKDGDLVLLFADIEQSYFSGSPIPGYVAPPPQAG